MSSSMSCIAKPGKGQAKAGDAKKVLACVSCQKRKKKCDRSNPCSNCVQLGITCTASQPALHRKRRRRNQEMVERLERCEKLLRELAKGRGNGSTLSDSRPEELISTLDSVMTELGGCPKSTDTGLQALPKKESNNDAPVQAPIHSIENLQLRPDESRNNR